MKSKSIIAILLCLVLLTALGLTACSSDGTQTESPSGQSESPSADNTPTPSESAVITDNEPEQTGPRVIVDLTGAEVEIPAASEINKVMIIAPPLVATYASVVKDTSKLVGVHPRALSEANRDVLKAVAPNWESINTSFVTGFTSNAEEVLNLAPDIILVYGDFQKDGLENVDIPVVDFYLNDTQNENWSVKIDALMREIFDIEEATTLQDEWDEANGIVGDALATVTDSDKKTAVMISSNTGDAITVRGSNYYGDDWLIKSGLINAAGELEGDGAEITMEQLYEWNPDIVYVFQGIDASVYLDNAIDGQDWSEIDAYKNGAIYDMPYGMFNWGAPNVDSPLTLIWMTMKNYPGTIDESYFNTYMKEYYQRQYGITLTDDMMLSILDPVK